jgi:hypothetical protein
VNGKRSDGLRCPGCSSGLNDTLDSRPTAMLEHFVTRRRKRCRSCGARWTTYEISSDDLRDILDLTTDDLIIAPDGLAAHPTSVRHSEK